MGIDVEQELHSRFRMVVPWGCRSEVYRYIVEMITKAIEEGGPAMLGAVLSQKVKLALDSPQGTNDEERGPNTPIK